jgi:hypothetical protein
MTTETSGRIFDYANMTTETSGRIFLLSSRGDSDTWLRNYLRILVMIILAEIIIGEIVLTIIEQ